MTHQFTRKIGHSNIEVSALGLGCWAIGGPAKGVDGKPVGYGKVTDAESIKAIQQAIELGCNFLDTADCYGTGHSEVVIGQAIKDFDRTEIVIATKFGNTFDSNIKQFTGTNSSPEYVKEALNASLKRLQTDYIDLYQLHLWTIPENEALAIRDALEDLVQERLIEAYGWSTDMTANAKLFAEGPHCTSIQHELNVLFDTHEILDVCETHNLAGINRTVLAMGLLTGKYTKDSQLDSKDDVRVVTPEWMKYFQNGGKPDPNWLNKFESIKDILTQDGRTVVQGALGWNWARSSQTIPIPGFKNVKQVEENVKALDFGPLKDSQMKAIDEILGNRTAQF
jgi:aryl-alcohol dehydrogenase-like predicted oxidoreductase